MLIGCSAPDISSKSLNGRELLDIPVNFGPKTQSLLLSDSETGYFRLATVATNVYLSVSGCSSGYSLPSTLVSNAFIRLFKGDESCLVKLEQFNFGSVTYAATGSNSVAFSNHLSGDIAVFQNTSDENDVINLFVNSQVTQGGLNELDTVSYAFTDRDSGTENNIEESNVIVSAGLTVGGADVPEFSITETRFLSMNANGTANLSFTLECDAALTGSSNPTYACENALLQSDLDYILTHDTYSGGSLTVDDANDAFAAGSPTTIGSLIVTAGGTDLDGNTLTNGGFYTSNASPLATTNGAIYPSNLSHVLMIRRQDSNDDTTGYLYFYVTIGSNLNYSSVSGCGVTFSGGSGTSGDPFLIASRSDLENTESCTSSSYYFQVAENIDLGGSGNPWSPITLYGHIDGNDKTISGLYIADSLTSGNAGLFDTLNSSSSITDLTLSNVDIASGAQNIGALSGNTGSSVTVTNFNLSGNVSTRPSVALSNEVRLGGVIGYPSTSLQLTNVHSTATVIWDPTSSGGTNLRAGGFIGLAPSHGLLIDSSSFRGVLEIVNTVGNHNNVQVGGLVGGISGSSTVQESWVDLDMNIDQSAWGNGQSQYYGGLVGNFGNIPNLYRSFATGTMDIVRGGGHNYIVGALLGRLGAPDGSGVFDSYTMMSITLSAPSGGAFTTGGFIGQAYKPVQRSYSANPSMTSGAGFISTVGSSLTDTYLYENGSVNAQTATGLTSYTTVNEMETQGNFSGFDFTTPIWRMPSVNPISPNGLLSPVLAWQCGNDGIVCN